ncbi:NUDIX hydrolase [Miniphocaeibacter massiliensis]|uniref:NUDIX hydrolase n=1 Tax=Miniphocaeibacter massiliensis TaxID=2041841 RepID=UPI000C1C7C73|nr:CoA pyrophosphatase [Miniphocaeibacter massiliensis]
MDLEKVFQKNKTKLLGFKNQYSVLILLTEIKGEQHIIFEKRGMRISQPGEVSLPGGMIEPGESPLNAARREASEELQIRESDIHIIGEIDSIYDFKDRVINIFIGRIQEFRVEEFLNNEEVEYVFTYPISYFIENKPKIYKNGLNNEIKESFPFELIPNGKNYKLKKIKSTTYFYEKTNPLIWGLTAKIISKFIDICEGESSEQR